MSASSPLLPLFKEQLEAQCDALAQKYNLGERGLSLIYWYFIHLKGLADTDIEGILCDGGGDLGIDSIWIDDEDLIHFYQFKNPVESKKGIPAGDVDKTISGLRLILNRKHAQIANPELKARVDEIYQAVPKGYRIHFISSGRGLEQESKTKLDALVEELSGPSTSIVSWDEQPLSSLQETFYQQSLPAVTNPLKIASPRQPYAVRSGRADCYLFHVTGQVLADLYEQHGEGLLQRNIRVDQGETAPNKAIEETCAGDDSANFLHFNNGVTFLCDSASYDQFQQILTLERSQVVNGGQTIRALHRKRGSLRNNVLVPARVITSSGDKDFANNVAVNQNNQNPMNASFLRSNDQRVVQLDHALASLGWYLERREGELSSATADEKAAIETRIGNPLDQRVIRLKEGAQAYTATFYGQPEIAKKNPAKIFQAVSDGGYFERIFSADITAEKVIIAHKIKVFVDDFVKKFSSKKRKLQASDDIVATYVPLVGADLAREDKAILNQVVAQCSLFLCGTLYKDLVDFQKKDPSEIPKVLETDSLKLVQTHLLYILNYAKSNPSRADRSWPVLLKNNTFFNYICAYIEGIRSGNGISAMQAAQGGNQ